MLQSFFFKDKLSQGNGSRWNTQPSMYNTQKHFTVGIQLPAIQLPDFF